MKPPRPKSTLLDRAVAYFDPLAGLRRAQARSYMALSGSYDAASRDSRTGRRWFTFARSADGDLTGELPEIRKRSRDQVRNNPLAGGAIAQIVSRTVGTGMSLHPMPNRRVLGWDQQRAEDWRNVARDEFNAWATSRHCTLDGVGDFYDWQTLAFRTTLESGDGFTLLANAGTSQWPIGLRLQLLEADRCGNPGAEMDRAGMYEGVQFDPVTGRRTAYHFYDRHPGGLELTRPPGRWVAAFTRRGTPAVLHHFRQLRPEQTRGVPHLSPVLDALKQLDRYTEAEILAAVISGMFTVFVKSDKPDENPVFAGQGTGSADSTGELKLDSGMVIGLNPGESIETANPGRPNTAFDPFVQAILRQVAIGLELPYEVLVKHFTSSYSAARAALLDAWQFFKGRREWLVKSACQPVWEAFLEEAVAAGRISAPGFFRDPLIRAAYCQALWTGDGPGSIDPVKDVEFWERAVALRIATRGRAESELFGTDFASTFDAKVSEERMLEEGGLIAEPGDPMPAAPAAPGGGAADPGDPSDPSDGPAEQDDESDETLPDD